MCGHAKLEGNGPMDIGIRAMMLVLEAYLDLRFEISSLYYPGMIVHVAVLVASEAMVASK